jgi:DNA helicase IV
MDDHSKSQLLAEAKRHIQKVQGSLDKEIEYTKAIVTQVETGLKTQTDAEAHIQFADTDMKFELYRINKFKLEGLESIYSSPYFVKCQVLFDGSSFPQTLFFAKYSFPQETIYSWVAPAARIRFEEIGEFSYPDPDGRPRKGKLISKDQYMIVDGKILFMTSEATQYGRTLVHQEHLSKKKSGFVLPEIVQQMEKAQDEVIRAHHRGSFLISGPAGSGKTTLALHRVAYLVQSPETEGLYKSKDIIVFVQDASTQQYFSSLLPELGIHDVKITTFADWAIKILGLEDVNYVRRYGDNEEERDLLEFYKNKALDKFEFIEYSDDIYDLLGQVYLTNFTKEVWNLFKTQKERRVLDRFDLTVLLKLFKERHGNLSIGIKRFEKIRGRNKMKEVIVRDDIEYSLIIVDEVQNYLPDQISLFKSTVHKKKDAMLYVGDLAQQTQLCTLKDWDQVNEMFLEGRKVELQKVYRNTKQILEYIQSLGYKVSIPQGIHEGKPVVERTVNSKSEEIEYIQQLIIQNPEAMIGILGKTPEYLVEFIEAFKDNPKIHVLTINESQGVEFETVCMVGVNEENYVVNPTNENYSEELIKEKKKVNRDLLYVGLTRAMNEMHVMRSGES